MRVHIQERQGPRRCIYCHEDGAEEACVSCGASVHPDCRKILARCPTIGCASSIVADFQTRSPSSFGGTERESPYQAAMRQEEERYREEVRQEEERHRAEVERLLDKAAWPWPRETSAWKASLFPAILCALIAAGGPLGMVVARTWNTQAPPSVSPVERPLTSAGSGVIAPADETLTESSRGTLLLRTTPAVEMGPGILFQAAPAEGGTGTWIMGASPYNVSPALSREHEGACLSVSGVPSGARVELAHVRVAKEAAGHATWRVHALQPDGGCMVRDGNSTWSAVRGPAGNLEAVAQNLGGEPLLALVYCDEVKLQVRAEGAVDYLVVLDVSR